MADRTAWRICSELGWWSVFGKKRAKNGERQGPPVHDDRCAVVDKHGAIRHEFTADAPNRLWLVDIERHVAWLNRAVVKGHRLRSVAADRVELRAAWSLRREGERE
jgi:hypothetical protein